MCNYHKFPIDRLRTGSKKEGQQGIPGFESLENEEGSNRAEAGPNRRHPANVGPGTIRAIIRQREEISSVLACN